MTSFVNQPFMNVFGDTLTTTNSGSGLSTTPQQLQDGLGNASTITIATTGINFSRGGGDFFQLDGVDLTASAANINAICGGTPIFPPGTPITLPTIAADPIGVAGMIYYNTTSNAIRVYITGLGWASLNHTP